MPSARLRSRPSAKVVVRIESAAGESSAAPSPCSERKAISEPSDQASPSSSELAVNSARPDHEQAPAAEQVGEPPAEHQHAAEEDRVGGDHPLQADLREVQVGLDRRQRDVDDRDVEDDHELRHDDQRRGRASAAGRRASAAFATVCVDISCASKSLMDCNDSTRRRWSRYTCADMNQVTIEEPSRPIQADRQGAGAEQRLPARRALAQSFKEQAIARAEQAGFELYDYTRARDPRRGRARHAGDDRRGADRSTPAGSSPCSTRSRSAAWSSASATRRTAAATSSASPSRAGSSSRACARSSASSRTSSSRRSTRRAGRRSTRCSWRSPTQNDPRCCPLEDVT